MLTLLRRLSILLYTLVALRSSVVGEQWPQWRGPRGDGTAQAEGIPWQWNREQNIAWKYPLPEAGNSTPVVWSDQVFVTQPQGNQRTLISIDRETGTEKWKLAVPYDEEEPTHRTNPYCSASPVTDGEVVIAWFGSAGLVASDLQGHELWRRDLGRQTHEWGTGSSPVLVGDLCVVQCGAGTREYVTAVNRRTGHIAWQQDTPRGDPSEIGDVGPPDQSNEGRNSNRSMRGAWGTPAIVLQDDEKPLLIVASPLRVNGYDAMTGQMVWTCRGLGPLIYASPVVHDNLAISLGGYHSASLAVRFDGQGDVTDSHRLWHEPRGPLWLGTGVVREDSFYVQDMQGILHCLSIQDMSSRGRKRLAAASDNQASWSSPLLLGDRLLIMNQNSDVFVIRADPTLEIFAINSLDEPTNSSLAVAGGDLFIRTHRQLWCVRDLEELQKGKPQSTQRTQRKEDREE